MKPFKAIFSLVILIRAKIELMQVKTRNLIYVDLDQQLLEILEDQTGNLYNSEDDFILEKNT